MQTIRRCRLDEQETILSIINHAATRYRGVIPADCWHDPYMHAAELAREIANGVTFWGAEGPETRLAGVMGIQCVKDVTLVRHAYVHPEHQGKGIGSLLLQHLETLTDRRILIGTWAGATWAIRFYEAHGYALIPSSETPALLKTYWGIPSRQIETSVVLVKVRGAALVTGSPAPR
jgi:GNAT superfamily N-acetyltransferase